MDHIQGMSDNVHCLYVVAICPTICMNIVSENNSIQKVPVACLRQ